MKKKSKDLNKQKFSCVQELLSYITGFKVKEIKGQCKTFYLWETNNNLLWCKTFDNSPNLAFRFKTLKDLKFAYKIKNKIIQMGLCYYYLTIEFTKKFIEKTEEYVTLVTIWLIPV